MIDHFGGSDRRHPDRAVWRTPPAKILPVCGKAWRCGNQRNEASNRLRRRGVCLLRAWLPTCVLRKKLAGEPRAIRECRIRSGKQSAACAVRGVRFYRYVCPYVFFAKSWQENQGRCENTEIGSRSLSITCPVQSVRFYRCACPHAVFRTKNPPAGKPGDFYQAFAVRWVFSRAITTGGISTS